MSCGYACIDCGKRKGEVRHVLRPGLCPFCQSQNAPDANRCAVCGKPILPPPGQPFAQSESRAAMQPKCFANPSQL